MKKIVCFRLVLDRRDLDVLKYDVSVIKGQITVLQELSSAIKQQIDATGDTLPTVIDLDEGDDVASVDTSGSIVSKMYK